VDVIQHVEHALNVCREDHVGIGTDGGIPTVELTAEYGSESARRSGGDGPWACLRQVKNRMT
jgi:membrane dipeptidase